MFLGGYYGEDGPVEIVHEPIYCDQCGYYHSDFDCQAEDYEDEDEDDEMCPSGPCDCLGGDHEDRE